MASPAPEMNVRATEHYVKEIVEELLKPSGDMPVVLTGPPGVGKTWMARRISELATAEGAWTLWISLDKSHDENSLFESIARQLSLPTSADEKEEDEKEDDSVDSFKQKIKEKLEKKAKENKYILLVWDDVRDMEKKHDVMVKRGLQTDLIKEKLKVLITCRDQVLITHRDQGGDITEGSMKILVKPLLEGEALDLLQKSVVKEGVSDNGIFKLLSKDLAERSSRLPAEIVIVAGALNYITKHDSGAWALEHALDIAANDLTQLLHWAFDMLKNKCVKDCFWQSWHFLAKGSVHYNELITHWIMEGYFDPFDRIEKAYEKGHHVLMELVNWGLLKMQEDNFIALEAATLDTNDDCCCGFLGAASLGLTSLFENDKLKGLIKAPTGGMIRGLSSDKKDETVSLLLVDGHRLHREVSKTFFEKRRNLEVLAIFDSVMESLSFLESKVQNLVVLVLRGCYLSKGLSQTEELKKLTVLEISGATSLVEIPQKLFKDVHQLRSLNLSAIGIKSLPSSISNLTELRRLILRQCSSLEELPKSAIAKLKYLEVLDLSECTSLVRMNEKSFQSLENLQILNVSQTKIDRLPFLATTSNRKPSEKPNSLRCLLAKGCVNLRQLCSLEKLPSLKIVDLSGASLLPQINTDCFKGTDNLEVLDLSEAKIKSLPSLSSKLRVLKLKRCSALCEFPQKEKLQIQNLEFLDLSDASSLEDFEFLSSEHLKNLHYLNLSNTKVKSLPFLNKLSKLQRLLLKGCSSLENLLEMKDLVRLRELDLSGCKNLEKLPHLNVLENLEVLDLSGCIALSEIHNESFQKMSRLLTLNLSETLLEGLPSLSAPSNLCSLVLRNCPKLARLPDLGSLSKLEELDLFGSNCLSEIKAESLNHLTQLQNLQILKLPKIKLEDFSFISKLKKLTKLSLEDCCDDLQLGTLTELKVLELSGEAVKSLPSLDNLSKLHELSLQGCSNLEMLPSRISEWAYLRRLHLPDLKIIEAFGWDKIKRLPEELCWENCSISISETLQVKVDGNRPYIMVHGTKFFRRLKKDPEWWNKATGLFQKLIWSVHSCKPQGKNGDDYSLCNKLLSNDIYFRIKDFPPSGENGQSLEICGFDGFPTEIEDVLKQAQYISLIENKFLKCLSDLKAENLQNVKGCWLASCTEVKSIFEGKDLELGTNLEILWLSNLPNLTSLYNGKEMPLSLTSLRDLHIDCCPMLETLRLPENLESLQIKFCDKMKTLFGETEVAKKEPSSGIINIKHLHVIHCPMLETVFTSAQLPENLETIEIKFCVKLKSLSRQQVLGNSELTKLQSLHLLELPELVTLGVKLPKYMPEKPHVYNCPNLPESEIPKSRNASEDNNN